VTLNCTATPGKRLHLGDYPNRRRLPVGARIFDRKMKLEPFLHSDG
jgi:hypothetical protein